MDSLFANDTLVTFLSVMCAVFALHLVLKRDQITREQQVRTAKDIQSLSELKLELQSNLQICTRLVKPAEISGYFQMEVWEKYRENFPLFHEELARTARCYESFNNWNDRLRSGGKIDAAVIESAIREVEAVLRAVENALNDLA